MQQEPQQEDVNKYLKRQQEETNCSRKPIYLYFLGGPLQQEELAFEKHY